MEEIVKFLKEAETYYLATVEGDQPRVRPFGTAHIFEGKLYIQTGKKKDVSKQLHANPKAELCAFKGGEWIRVMSNNPDFGICNWANSENSRPVKSSLISSDV